MGWWSRLFGGEADSATTSTPAPSEARREPTLAAAPAAHPDIDQQAAVALRQDSPEFDEFIARAELQAGTNLPHGAQHLANLLVVDPTHPRWRELLERYMAAAGSRLDALVPDVDPRHAATESLRAWIWHAQGRRAEAVSRLVDVARALGDAAMIDAWALDWLAPAGAIESLPEDVGHKLFGFVLTQHGELAQASARRLDAVRRWSTLLERVASSWEDTSLLRLMRAGLMRKAGHADDALALVGPLDDGADFNRIVAIGLALRAKGRLVESAQVFERGAAIEADGVTAWLEAGDSWLAAERWPEAIAAYEQALARQPGQEWAQPSADYCRWKTSGGDPWSHPVGQALQGGSERARELLFRDLGGIDESRDASAGTLRQLRASWLQKPVDPARDGISRMSVSTIEAPSARLAASLELAAFGLDPQVEVGYGGVPALDPRVAVADIAWPLWIWDGLQPRPGLPAAAPEVTALVAGLASQRYDPWANWAQASHVAARLGGGATADILAVMVNPPPVPANTHALAWLPRVQLAAAMVAAQVDAGWEDSRRRAALHSLLLGPSDWTTVAGIRALGWVARTEPAHAQDIHRMFEERERHLPSEGHWDWVAVLYAEWQKLPWLFDREREALKAKLAALE